MQIVLYSATCALYCLLGVSHVSGTDIMEFLKDRGYENDGHKGKEDAELFGLIRDLKTMVHTPEDKDAHRAPHVYHGSDAKAAHAKLTHADAKVSHANTAHSKTAHANTAHKTAHTTQRPHLHTRAPREPVATRPTVHHLTRPATHHVTRAPVPNHRSATTTTPHHNTTAPHTTAPHTTAPHTTVPHTTVPHTTTTTTIPPPTTTSTSTTEEPLPTSNTVVVAAGVAVGVGVLLAGITGSVMWVKKRRNNAVEDDETPSILLAEEERRRSFDERQVLESSFSTHFYGLTAAAHTN